MRLHKICVSYCHSCTCICIVKHPKTNSGACNSELYELYLKSILFVVLCLLYCCLNHYCLKFYLQISSTKIYSKRSIIQMIFNIYFSDNQILKLNWKHKNTCPHTCADFNLYQMTVYHQISFQDHNSLLTSIM